MGHQGVQIEERGVEGAHVVSDGLKCEEQLKVTTDSNSDNLLLLL